MGPKNKFSSAFRTARMLSGETGWKSILRYERDIICFALWGKNCELSIYLPNNARLSAGKPFLSSY